MTDSEGSLSAPADTMHERAGDGRFKGGLIIEGNRGYVAGVLLGVAFLVIVLCGLVYPGTFESVLTTQSVRSMFQSIFLSIVTSIALVLAIGQLILSEEMGDLGEQRSRMQDEIQFRGDVETAVGVDTPPATPGGFLQVLLLGAKRDAQKLKAALEEEPETESAAVSEVREFTEIVVEHVDSVVSGIEGTDFGSFRTLSAVLDFNYSWKTRTARRLRDRHAEALSAETTALLDEQVQNLSLFGPTRQYFKLLYYQHELIDVSRLLLYTAMPALGITSFMSFAFDTATFSGTILGLDATFLVVAVTVVVSLVPFGLLLSYMLRMVSVTQRTLTIGPFILREDEEGEGITDLAERVDGLDADR